jgi:hypothetical protein
MPDALIVGNTFPWQVQDFTPNEWQALLERINELRA